MLLLNATHLPLPLSPGQTDMRWTVDSRSQIREWWAARNDSLDDVLLNVTLAGQMVHARIVMCVPKVFVWHRIAAQSNDVLAWGMRLSQFICQELHIIQNNLIVEASMMLCDIPAPYWNTTVYLDSAQQSENERKVA
jgi:hypothetical protein